MKALAKMRTGIIFAGGGAAGALAAVAIMASSAQSQTNAQTSAQAGIAALEARIAELEQRVGTQGETVSINAPKHLAVTAGKTMTVNAGEPMSIATQKGLTVTSGKIMTLTAGDEIYLGTGKAHIRMYKSGQIEITGGDIYLSGTKITAKDASGTPLQGSKILGN